MTLEQIREEGLAALSKHLEIVGMLWTATSPANTSSPV